MSVLTLTPPNTNRAYFQGGTDMPTGYTAGVGDGKVVTFRDFALDCARAFGALVELRDSPSAPIPDEFEVDPYPMRRLIEDRERLAELRAMTGEDADRAADAAYNEELAHYRRRQREQATTQARYEAMLDEALRWQPPSPDHVEMKNFMVKQLEESIRFDCGYEPQAPTRMTAAEWLTSEIDRAERNAERHAEEHEKAVERAEGRSRWVKQLRESLAGYERVVVDV